MLLQHALSYMSALWSLCGCVGSAGTPTDQPQTSTTAFAARFPWNDKVSTSSTCIACTQWRGFCCVSRQQLEVAGKLPCTCTGAIIAHWLSTCVFKHCAFLALREFLLSLWCQRLHTLQSPAVLVARLSTHILCCSVPCCSPQAAVPVYLGLAPC